MIQQTPLSWYNSLPLDSTLIKMEELGLISDSNSHDGIMWEFLVILIFAIICLFIYHLRVLSTKVKIALVAFFTAFALVAAKTVTAIGTTKLNLLDRKD